MVMPGIDEEEDWSAGAAFAFEGSGADSAGFFAAVFAFRFAAVFFFAACFEGMGIVMPGMFICATAGVAANASAVRIGKTFSGRPCLENWHPRPDAEGASHNHLAAAVLAGAGIAMAAAVGTSALAVPLRFDGLAILHSWSPFSCCSVRANRHITSVPWYRVKPFNR